MAATWVVRARRLGLWIAAALAGSACHDSRLEGAGAGGADSTGERARTTTAAATGSDSSAPEADAVTSTGATATPLASAAIPEGVTRRSEESVPAAALRGAVQANNEFATALFGALRSEIAGANFLTSPISASLALGMTYAGARGQTRTEMARALRFGALSDASVFSGQNGLSQQLSTRGALAFERERAALRSDPAPPQASDYSLEIVNSLWGQAGYPWQRPFLTTLAENYGAGLFNRDFKKQPQATRLEINRWVSTHTADKIQDLLGDSAVTADTRLVLVNALHLKLPWDTPFPESATKPGQFMPSNHKPVTVPFMHHQAEWPYRDDGSAQIVALPLSSRKLWVIIALPHAGISLTKYERTLRADSAALVVPRAASLVALSLPQLTFTSPSFSLREALERLGMVQAFDPEHAHFEGMCSVPPPDDNPLYVSDVLQKTMISMQEKGVEAAAATAVVVATLVSARRPLEVPVPIPMLVDRPYLLAVVDEPTGAILMLAHIEEPKN